MTRFRSVLLLQRPAGGASTVSRVRVKGDQDYLQEQLDRRKLDQYMDPAASEALFARRVLLVEGHGDRLAAEFIAHELDLDLDAESLSVIPCGGKTAIPFFGRMCRALGIPCVVLHDEDLHTADSDEPLSKRQLEDNARAPQQNADIEDAVGEPSVVFKMQPSLEATLGIGRDASHKPTKVVQRLTELGLKGAPQGLVDAVRALAEETPSSSNGSAKVG